MKNFFFILILVSFLIGSFSVNASYVTDSIYEKYHKVKLDENGNELAWTFYETEDGTIYEIYGDGTAEVRYRSFLSYLKSIFSPMSTIPIGKCCLEGSGTSWSCNCNSGFWCSSDEIFDSWTACKTERDIRNLGGGSNDGNSALSCTKDKYPDKCASNPERVLYDIHEKDGKCYYYKKECGSDEICRNAQCVKKDIDGKECSDTDGGINPNVYGEVTDPNGYVYKDFCDTDKVLKEEYCADDGFSSYKNIDCDKCENGACVLVEKCSNPNGNVEQFYCKDGQIYKCTSDGWKPYDKCDSEFETGKCKITTVSDSQVLCELKERTDCENPNGGVGQFYCKNGIILECISEFEGWEVKYICSSEECKTIFISDSPTLCKKVSGPEPIVSEDDKHKSLTKKELNRATKTQLVQSACFTDNDCRSRSGYKTFCDGGSEVMEIINAKFGNMVGFSNFIGTSTIDLTDILSKIFEKDPEGICIAEPINGENGEGEIQLGKYDPCVWGESLSEGNGCLVGWGVIALIIIIIIVLLKTR